MDKLLNVNQVAEILHCHPQSVYKNKGLPFVKIPGVGKRYKESDIEKCLENNSYKPTHLNQQPIYNQSFNLNYPPYYGKILPNKKGGICELAKSKTKTRHNFGYGAIYQRKTKKGKIRWYLDYRDRNGKRIQTVVAHALSAKEAQEALKDSVLKEHNRRCGIEKQERISFSKFAEVYLENYAKVNKKSWKDDQYRIDAHMNPFFGGLELQEIDPLRIEKFRAVRLKTGVSKSTTNREITIMKRMFNLAMDWNFTDRNPVMKIRLFSEKDTEKERILTDEEELRLLSASPIYLKPILVAALNTGMRRGEIFNLKWDQVDFSQRTIKATNTKSGKNRIIPINWLLLQELVLQKRANGKCAYVFPNPDTKKPFIDVKKSFKDACVKAKIKDLRFHDLRHTFASRLVKAGVDLITVRDLLGHFSVRVTQRYTHSSRDQKAHAVDLLTQKTAKKTENGQNLLHNCYIN